MTITERIFATDYSALEAAVLVGHFVPTILVTDQGLSYRKGKGLGNSCGTGGGFNVSTQMSRTLGTSISTSGGFNCYKLDPSFIINPPSLTPVTPTDGPSFVLSDLTGSGGPPGFDLGNRKGVPTYTLSYGGTSISLGAPELADSSTIDQRHINVDTFGGAKIIYRDPNWTSKEELKVQFSNLTKGDMITLREFLRLVAGRTFQVTDHKGFNWDVKHTNPDTEFTESANHRFSVSLELETIE